MSWIRRAARWVLLVFGHDPGVWYYKAPDPLEDPVVQAIQSGKMSEDEILELESMHLIQSDNGVHRGDLT